MLQPYSALTSQPHCVAVLTLCVVLCGRTVEVLVTTGRLQSGAGAVLPGCTFQIKGITYNVNL